MSVVEPSGCFPPFSETILRAYRLMVRLLLLLLLLFLLLLLLLFIYLFIYLFCCCCCGIKCLVEIFCGLLTPR